MRKRNFLLCKIFANFLQILNLHTDFRPREESVRSVISISYCTFGDREGSYEKSTNILDSWKEFENAFNT